MRLMFNVLFSLLALGLSALAGAAPRGEVLVLLSGKTALPLQGGKTFPSGYYLNEFGVPADALQRAGYRLTIVTPTGERPQADQRSIEARYFQGKHDAWEPHVVVDRELITGQNPFSDQLLAQALLKALAHRAAR